MSSTTAPPDQQPDTLEVVNVEGGRSTVLRRDALGLPALLFSIVSAAAPLTALLFNVPVITSGGGSAVPGAFIVGVLFLLVFSVGYIEISRHVTSAGGFYSFVSHGFGQITGLGVASLIALSYPILTASIIGIFAYFANTTIDDWIGLSIPVWVLLAGALLANLAFAWFDIKITARVLAILVIAEIAGALVLTAAVLLAGGDSGLPAAPLSPLGFLDNDHAVSVFGAAAPGIALFGAFWSFTGFEQAPNYGEETKDAKSVSAKATYGTLIVLGLIYVVASYAFVVGWGVDHSAQAVKDQFDGKVASAWYPLTDRYVGGALTTAFQGLIVTSAFACQLAFFNVSSRYVFALGRDRILPAKIGETHGEHQTPHVASLVVAGFIALFIAGFLIDDSSTEAALTKLGTWPPLLGIFGLLAVQVLTSLAIVAYFWRGAGRGKGSVVKTLVFPILGAVLIAYSAKLLLSNRETLAAGNPVFVQVIPWVALALFLIGIAAGFWFRAKDPDRYEAVGRFVHEDA